jgi:hypothetical protein
MPSGVLGGLPESLEWKHLRDVWIIIMTFVDMMAVSLDLNRTF